MQIIYLFITLFISVQLIFFQTSEAILTIPADSAVNGNCGAKNSMMELTWLEKSKGSNSYKDEKNNSFKINFQKGESNYLLHSIELNIYMDETNFPNSNGNSFFFFFPLTI